MSIRNCGVSLGLWYTRRDEAGIAGEMKQKGDVSDIEVFAGILAAD